MTKADKIRALHKQGLTVRQIAAEVYGIDPNSLLKGEHAAKFSYVNVVAKQRQDGTSRAEAKYLKKKYGTNDLTEAWKFRARERYADPVQYEKHLARCRAHYHKTKAPQPA